jgi:GTPase
MFADRARIHVSAGAGGDGSASFRREAHVPRGGPDGGDGGNGGSVILTAMAGMTTLGDYRRRRHVRAAAGGKGTRRRSHGRDGADVELGVPPGTVVRTAVPAGGGQHGWLGELLKPGERLVVARGGRGGRGNVHFASATHRAPTHAEKGEPGEERWIELELKLIADVGLVGAPNAGKSTLLGALTAAEPRIADYPFTTVTPNLGVLALGDDEQTAVLADVPGLIEGASEGRGLGHGFLRHVERTRVIVGVVDGAADDPVAAWRLVAAELQAHDATLLDRPMVIVVTKQDLPAARAQWPRVRRALIAEGLQPIAVSALAETGLDRLRGALRSALAAADDRERREPTAPEVRVHRFDPLETGWRVSAEPDGLRVRGRRVEAAAARTNFENAESRERFWRMLERVGIGAELRSRGAATGTTVRIGDAELEWDEE